MRDNVLVIQRFDENLTASGQTSLYRLLEGSYFSIANEEG